MAPTPQPDDSAERITTGVDRLDGVLGGGMPLHAVVFVAGLPGTGKTILCQQALFANARAGKKCLYLSTISEPPLKVLSFLHRFGFYNPQLFGSKVIYGDLGGTLLKSGGDGLLQQLDRLVREHRPDVLVIDSFKAVRDLVRDPLAFRELTSDLAIRLSTWEVTSLLVGEYSAEDVRTGAEFAIADGILYLYGTEEPERQKRFLRVMKMRGTRHYGGEHFFEITSQGVILYPRMNALVTGEYEFPGGRIGSTIEGMDEVLGGGLFMATVTLLSGCTGTGKTLTALSFLVAAARRGEPGLLVTFEESPLQVSRNCQAFGWDLEGLQRDHLLDILHVSPSELNVDRHAFDIRERAERLGAKVVVLDSISAFQAAVPETHRYQGYLWAIADHFKRKGISVIMTCEATNPFGPPHTEHEGFSFISDNSIYLRYTEVEGEVRRVLSVLKMRGSQHDRHLRELIIEPPRLAVGAALHHAGLPGVVGPA